MDTKDGRNRETEVWTLRTGREEISEKKRNARQRFSETEGTERQRNREKNRET